MTDAVWPFAIEGTIESVIATRGPDGAWNQAALGLRGSADHGPDQPVTARTWGDTRTRRNLDRTGEGVVQFVDDPVTFVEAALGISETDRPVLDDAAAHVDVETEPLGEGYAGGTAWIEWELRPVTATVRRRTVPRLTRGTAAIVEMTVAASRLDVPTYDETELRDQLTYFAAVVRRCGTPRDRTALARITELAPWDPAVSERGRTRDASTDGDDEWSG